MYFIKPRLKLYVSWKHKQFLRPRHWGQSANNKLFIDALIIALHILIS
jgi:hypothetical protein